MDIAGAWSAMVAAIRNLGRPGIASMAISAVDAALWDLKARLLELPLVTLLGAMHDAVPVYGSGGFTSYTSSNFRTSSPAGSPRASHGQDEDRPRSQCRFAPGPGGSAGHRNEAELFVDANGAYSRKEALGMRRDSPTWA